MNKLITLKDWLDWVERKLQAADIYYGHGTDNAWDEAVQLVLQACELPIESGEEVLGHIVSANAQDKIKSWLILRIEEHKPLPYITHQAWFMGIPFYVDERVLIPRSPFGEWIAKEFHPWIDSSKVQRILEIGTGSGCMAIAAAFVFPEAMIDAVDISDDALEVAKMNVKHYQLQDRVRLIKSDCFASLNNAHYDVIMSNPPYVSSSEMVNLPAEYLHEPREALETDDHGLAIAKRIIEQADQHLNPQGILLLEVGNNEEALADTYPEVPFTWLEQEHGGHGLLMITKEELESELGHA